MNTHFKTAAFATLGCKVNQCDSAAMQHCLEQDGFQSVPFGSPADVCIVNTCVVTGRTEAQSRQLVRRALRSAPSGQVLVTGCYAQRAPDDLLGISPRVHCIGNDEKKDIVFFCRSLDGMSSQLCRVSDIQATTCFATPAFSRFPGRSRAFLKIQDGCNSRCTYCVVPSVRGRSRSLPPGEMCRRLDRLIHAGYREIVLTGIHLGAYGLDLSPPASFESLVRTIDTDPACERVRIRLSSIEPMEFSPGLLSCFASSERICPHVHIPLQSGDDAVLKRMNRPYATAFFRDLLLGIHAAVPDAAIGVDVIAGFPGEDEASFTRTHSFLESLPITYVHAFPYSRRPGTSAAAFTGQVDERVKKRRVTALRALSDDRKASFYASFTGKVLEVLVEGDRDREAGHLKGVSRNYIPVAFQGTPDMIGSEVPVRIESASAAGAAGCVCDRAA